MSHYGVSFASCTGQRSTVNSTPIEKFSSKVGKKLRRDKFRDTCTDKPFVSDCALSRQESQVHVAVRYAHSCDSRSMVSARVNRPCHCVGDHDGSRRIFTGGKRDAIATRFDQLRATSRITTRPRRTRAPALPRSLVRETAAKAERRACFTYAV